ncbi:glycosyltransferase [Microbacterium sp. OR21]|uniref:glycosyltransferase family 4 protein n=1 Tax=Microbacterium sp. OR21 TaxID=3095346 RepID=UPI0039B6B9BE
MRGGVPGVVLQALTVITDVIPPRYRFGHWRRAMDMLRLPGGLPSVPRDGLAAEPAAGPAAGVARPDASACPEADPHAAEASDTTCMIVAGALDTGGVEAVVVALALGLASQGVDVEVVCTSGGRCADDIRARGGRVAVVPAEMLAEHVRGRDPDVIQLHRLEPGMLAALTPYAHRSVVVFHAMEAYLNRRAWRALAEFTAHAGPSIAVSAAVRDFFVARLGPRDIHVVVNGIPGSAARPRPARVEARARVSAAIGTPLADDDVLVVGLQRYSDQKNAAGLVDALLLAAQRDPRLRLVVAGAPESWLEVRRADAVRRRHPLGHRVHLLADSDPEALLAAADLFALDSFAEGGPLVALEAVAAGVPVVLSDVGFAGQLIASDPRVGEVVPRASRDVSHRAVARERRRHHQSNRALLADALNRQAARTSRPPAVLPEVFALETMLSAHARVLRDVAGHGLSDVRAAASVAPADEGETARRLSR